jgi:hypothetical protein
METEIAERDQGHFELDMNMGMRGTVELLD